MEGETDVHFLPLWVHRKIPRCDSSKQALVENLIFQCGFLIDHLGFGGASIGADKKLDHNSALEFGSLFGH